MKKKDNGKIKHIDNILKEIEGHFTYENEDLIFFDEEYNLFFLELLRTCSNISRRDLQKSLIEMKKKNSVFNHKEFVEEYSGQLKIKTRKNEGYKFYFLLNHSTDINVTLSNFKIRRLIDQERELVVKRIKFFFSHNHSSNLEHKIDFTKNEVYVFESESYNSENVLDNFYSTFRLYKGILEYSYHRFKWKNEFFNNIKNKKEFSCFKYPLFIYINKNGFYDFIYHEDYPYDYMKYMENVNSKGNLKFFEETLKVFGDEKLDNGIEGILSDCLRLYGTGIDIPYIDQSFLFFWNVLEKITLSIRGDTEQVIKRIRDFFSEKFWNDNQNSITYLKDIRNNRVHKGTGDISILDLNLLKYLCDICIYSILGNPPGSEKNFKTTKHLEVFYTIKDNQNLKEIKDIIDFIIKTKTKK